MVTIDSSAESGLVSCKRDNINMPDRLMAWNFAISSGERVVFSPEIHNISISDHRSKKKRLTR